MHLGKASELRNNTCEIERRMMMSAVTVQFTSDRRLVFATSTMTPGSSLPGA